MPGYPELDHTNDPAARSWVGTANDGINDFPVQNLPLGIFSAAGLPPRAGMAIGASVLDLVAASDLGLLGDAVPRELLAKAGLNDLFAAGHGAGLRLRHAAFALLEASDTMGAQAHAGAILHDMETVTMHRPVHVGNYTDFYAGIHHAVRAGGLLQPENPLPDNYKWVPIGYHGRASTTRVSGTDVRRPAGQFQPAPGAAPEFGPCRELDLELEMAVYVGRPTEWGRPLGIAEAAEHVAGYGLLNDWSARDIQRWEMKPLGPFLSKNLGTSLSPWVLSPQALAPFRVAMAPRDPADPQPLPYLMSAEDQAKGTFDVALSVQIRTGRMRAAGDAPVTIIRSNMRDLYWTPQQLLAHHTCSGCEMEAGDLIGTGTISGPREDELGSLLELTMNGARPVRLPNGETRSFLADGDEITLKGRCTREGFVPIGFGTCTGTVLPAPVAAAPRTLAGSPA
ncbi:fumarylacetoacetase [Mangrovicoccus sp. HB161399]|uniref:fumarylacetoacetase n=1 Tax=Mangrovicoccus sp. HB161399 TaxID=2720392 RepID=UPI0015558EE1|nr:fumarylacetoacetase [Mangrovicoccus sp. HB161399]